MPPTKQNPSHQYFTYNADKKSVTCLVDGCGKELKNQHAKNMERHLSSRHQTAYEAVIRLKAEAAKRKAEENLKKDLEAKKPKMMQIRMDFETLQQGCLEMVTLGGRPFSAMNDVGFRRIINPILDFVNKESVNKAINPQNMKDLVKETAIQSRRNIAEEVAGKLVSVKVDGGSRHGRSILGVNIQFIKDTKIQIRNVGMQELFINHTSENLKCEILKILERHNLSTRNIYTFTSDNAATMVKIPKLMGDEADHFQDEEFFDYEGSNLITSSMDGIDFYYDNDDDDLQVEGARCAPHTLQLAIDDVIKEMKLPKSLSAARELVKKLRTRTISSHLKVLGKSMPVLDVETRWHSMLDMIESLLALKEFCKDMEDADRRFYLPEEEWQKLEDLCKALTPARIAAKIFQEEQLLSGDFFGTWLQCKEDTKEASKNLNDIASKLVASMEQRENSLIMRTAIATSLYLDPRYNVILSETGIERAQERIRRVWKRLSDLRKEVEVAVEVEEAEFDKNAVTESDPDEKCSAIEKILRSKEKNRVDHVSQFKIRDLTQQLREFTALPRLSHKENLLQFWEARKYVWPDLYEVALVVHAHPVTQVSVERTFSHMAFVFSPLRCKTNAELLQDTLITSSNLSLNSSRKLINASIANSSIGKTPTKRSDLRSKKTPSKGTKKSPSRATTPAKTPSGGDRFIPSRSTTNFDLGYYKLQQQYVEQDGEKESIISPSKKEMQKLIGENLHGGDINNMRVLSYQNKAPAPPEGYQNPLRVVYSQSKTPASVKASARYIPQAPDRILDAPEIVDDYYLNLVDWSPNNILAVALGSTVYLWNAGTGTIEQLFELEGNDYVCSVAWIQQGPYLAIGMTSGNTELWDCSEMKRARVMNGHAARVGSLAWNHHVLTSGCRVGQIVHHDVRLRDHAISTINAHAQEVCGLKWCPDGKYLASGGNDNMLQIWSVVAGQHYSRTQPLFSLNQHQAAVKALAWCPWQTNILASGGGTADRMIRFWNCNTGACINSVDTKSQVCSLLWSTTYKEIVSGHGYAQNQLTIWKYPTMSKVAELTGHSSRVLHLAMSPDGTTVLSAGADETLRLWKCFQPDPHKKKDINDVKSVASRLKSSIR